LYNIENETGLSQSNAAALLLNMLSYGEMKNADAGLCKMAYNKLVKQNILVGMPTVSADDRGYSGHMAEVLGSYPGGR
jgi:hypothetical protein